MLPQFKLVMHPPGPVDVEDAELLAELDEVVVVIDEPELADVVDVVDVVADDVVVVDVVVVAPTEADVPGAPPVPPVNVNASPQPATAIVDVVRRPMNATPREAILWFIVGLGSWQRMASVYPRPSLLRRKKSRMVPPTTRSRPARGRRVDPSAGPIRTSPSLRRSPPGTSD